MESVSDQQRQFESCQQAPAGVGVSGQCHTAAFVGVDFKSDVQIGLRQKTGGFVRPFANLQTGCSKYVSEARVFPFLRVFEAVKIKMPDGQMPTIPQDFIRLDHRIGRAFDAPADAQGL